MKRLHSLCLTGFIIFSLSLAVSAAVPDDQHWDNQFGPPGINGNTYGVAVMGNKVYAAGLFTAAGGVKTPGVAGFDGTNWFPLNGGLPYPGGGSPTVISLATDNNYLYAGGLFASGDDPTAVNTARWDGTNWAGIGIQGIAFAVKRNGTNVYFAGTFNGAGNAAATNIARWDGANWYALGPGLNGPANIFAMPGISCMDFQGGNIYVGGTFSWAGALNMTNVAYWDGSIWHTMGNPFNGGVSALQFYGGYLYAAGGFTNTTLHFTNVARWNGSTWSALPGGSANRPVSGFATDGTNLFMCGTFTSIGGIAATNVVSFDGSNWTPLNSGLHYYQEQLGLPQAFKLCWVSNQLYVVGGFDRADNSGADDIARWDGKHWWSVGGDTSKGMGVGIDFVQSLFLLPNAINSGAVPAGLYAGGLFPVAGKTNANLIAYFDGTNWNPLGGGMSGAFASSARVYAFATDNTYLYAGGNFTNAGGYTSIGGVAYWDGSNWNPLSYGVDYIVNALAADPYGYVWIGGAFTNINYAGSSKGLALWSSGSWYTVGAVDGTNAIVYALVSDGGNRIYAGGQFYSIGGVSATNIAYWDWNDGWHALGPGLNTRVSALAYGNGTLYAGGTFTQSGSTAVNHAAQWNGASWSALGSGITGANSSSVVTDIAVSGTNVYFTGNFTNAGGVLASNVAVWNGSSWSALGSGTTGNPGITVSAVTAAGNDVYIGGQFNFAGDKPAQFIAHWNSQSNYYPTAHLQLARAAWQTNRQFRFRVNGTYGQPYIIQGSTNFSSWTPLQTNSTMFYDYNDSNSAAYPVRVYRAALQQ